MNDKETAPIRWNARFDRPDYFFGEAPAAFVRHETARMKPGSSVLAVADGEGRNSVWMARQGMHVTAFDSSDRGLQKARALATKAGVTVDFRAGDAARWVWNAATFDVVAAIFVQFAAPDLRDRMFAGFDRALAPGGLLLLHGFAPRQVKYGTGGPPHVANMYTLDLLRRSFAGYDVRRAADYDEVIDAGPGHNGRAALVDFVAVKPGGS